jgi:hypothetical protein
VNRLIIGGDKRHHSHDKSFPIGIAFGSRVFICDNLAFIGDHVVRRKHTVKAKKELPGLLTDIVAPLQAQRLAQNQKLLAYQGTPRAAQRHRRRLHGPLAAPARHNAFVHHGGGVVFYAIMRSTVEYGFFAQLKEPRTPRKRCPHCGLNGLSPWVILGRRKKNRLFASSATG